MIIVLSGIMVGIFILSFGSLFKLFSIYFLLVVMFFTALRISPKELKESMKEVFWQLPRCLL